MHTHPDNPGRFVRRATIAIILAVLLSLTAQLSLAQGRGEPLAQPVPAAPADGSLTVSVSTTPAGGEDFWLTAAAAPFALGQARTPTGRFYQPRDIEVDADGNLYIPNHRGHFIVKLNSSYQRIGTIGSAGSGNGQIRQPNQIAIYGTLLYVPENHNNRVSVFSTDGAFVRTIGSAGTGDGQFDSPQGVAVDGDGNVYVSDTFNHRIQVFNGNGVYLRQWGTMGSSTGQFLYPTHVTFDDNDNLYVADSNNSRIQVFDKQGTFIRQLGAPGSGPGQLNIPVGLDIAGGYLYISDTFNNRVQKWTLNGQYVAQWTAGEGGAPLDRPNGLLAVGDQLYVSDLHNHLVQVYNQRTFGLDDGQSASADLPAGTYTITQTPRTGWSLSNATCDSGNPTAVANGVQVLLGDGASVSCTFTSSQ